MATTEIYLFHPPMERLVPQHNHADDLSHPIEVDAHDDSLPPFDRIRPDGVDDLIYDCNPPDDFRAMRRRSTDNTRLPF